MTLAEQVRQAGVVGAGGAGFPTHVKLVAKAEWFLANGAECEPLLHKDRELMVHYADEIIDGLRLAAKSVGASKLHIGVKTKNAEAVRTLRKSTDGTDVGVFEFEDFYPSGDEYEIVHSITGKLIPPGGIPLAVGAVVNNVETLYQVHRAARGQPVTKTLVTITGMVHTPLTVWLPVGMRMSEALEVAGGPSVQEYAVVDSGVMMGRLVNDLNQPVTKTTAGLIVLAASHPLIQRFQTTPQAMARIGKSACDQCSYCTELCPRYLLGYDIQPHAVMRSLGYSATGSEIWNHYALLCCGCGICTLYACPESLFPREACLDGIADLKAVGRGKWEGPAEVTVHPMKEFRRVPMGLLMKKLGIEGLDAEAQLARPEIQCQQVEIPLKQHTGVPAQPVVTEGESIHAGQLIGRVPDDQLGANIHASIEGRVTAIDDSIRIERT